MRVLLQGCHQPSTQVGWTWLCGQHTYSLDMVLVMLCDAKPREILTAAMPGFWVILLPH